MFGINVHDLLFSIADDSVADPDLLQRLRELRVFEVEAPTPRASRTPRARRKGSTFTVAPQCLLEPILAVQENGSEAATSACPDDLHWSDDEPSQIDAVIAEEDPLRVAAVQTNESRTVEGDSDDERAFVLASECQCRKDVCADPAMRCRCQLDEAESTRYLAHLDCARRWLSIKDQKLSALLCLLDANELCDSDASVRYLILRLSLELNMISPAVPIIV